LNARIALLGFSIECNRWAPVAILRDFETRCLLRGADIVADARAASPSALGEMPGVVTTMDAAGPWTPCPIMLAMAEPNGPVDQTVFDGFMAEWRAGLEALRGACDGVYAVLHGAGLATGLSAPEAALQALVREILGDVPFICGYDLHGNMSAENVALNDAFVGYRTNPHVDMRPRGAEAAQLMLRMLAGERFIRAHRRLLAGARRGRVDEAGRPEAAQVGHHHPTALRGETRRDLDIGVHVVRKAVHQQHRRAVLGACGVEGDVEHAGPHGLRGGEEGRVGHRRVRGRWARRAAIVRAPRRIRIRDG
jgi:hypothetical protein